MPPLSLYVHFPWCLKKCPYCDFHSIPLLNSNAALIEKEYVDAMLLHAEQLSSHVQDRQIMSIFIGGGTPSLMSARYLEMFIHKLQKIFKFAPNIEITLEANPSTFEAIKFKDYRKLGINRLSIGVQSFNDQKLKALGRLHDACDAKKAVSIAKDAGFDNFNLDIMFGLPEQTKSEGLADLYQAINFEPTHFSWYQLTLEPNTHFYTHPPALPQSDLIADLQDEGIDWLKSKGYNRYEVSAFSRNRPCQHNLNYWQFGDYLALGAGAHGKLSLGTKIFRYQNVKNPKHYVSLNKPFVQMYTQILENDLPFEFMLNALRLIDGTPVSFFEDRTFTPLAPIEKILHSLKEKKLIKDFYKRIQTTPFGFRFLDTILDHFMDSRHAHR